MRRSSQPEITEGRDIYESLGVIWRRRWPASMAFVFAAGIIVVVGSTHSVSYQSASVVNLQEGRLANDARNLQNEIRWARGDELRSLARKRYPAAVKVKTETGDYSDYVAFIATAPSPEVAINTVNAYVDAYVEHRRMTRTEADRYSRQVIGRQLADINERIAGYQRDKAATTATEVYERLEREQLAWTKLQIDLRRDLAELSSKANQINDIRTVDYAGGAALLNPFPKIRLVMIAFVTGSISAALVALGALRIPRRLVRLADIEAVVGQETTVAIPSTRSWHWWRVRPARVGRRRHRRSDHVIRGLRTMLNVDAEVAGRVILITGVQRRSGTTLCATALARSFAETDERVLFVDANAERPALHRMFGIPNTGLADVLERGAAIGTAVHPLPGGELDVLCAGEFRRAADSVCGQWTHAIVERLTAEYDRVIIDGGAITRTPEVRLIAHHANTTIVVTRCHRSRSADLGTAMDLVEQVGVRRRVVVLSGTRRSIGQLLAWRPFWLMDHRPRLVGSLRRPTRSRRAITRPR